MLMLETSYGVLGTFPNTQMVIRGIKLFKGNIKSNWIIEGA
jgi:hypothetical protein